jgi:hypothetical protein
MNLFDKLSGRSQKNTVDQSFRLYSRDDKPVALQGWFFAESVVSKIEVALAETGLAWIWESTRTGPPLSTDEEESQPEHRARQVLTDDLIPLIKADLVERNLHGFRRFVALYGGTKDLLSLIEDDDLKREVDAFATGKQSALSILIVQMGDVAADIIYFVQTENPFINTFLTNLGAPAVSEVPKLRYREMNGEELETVIGYLSCTEHDH